MYDFLASVTHDISTATMQYVMHDGYNAVELQLSCKMLFCSCHAFYFPTVMCRVSTAFMNPTAVKHDVLPAVMHDVPNYGLVLEVGLE
jgi:hypothetical protein